MKKILLMLLVPLFISSLCLAAENAPRTRQVSKNGRVITLDLSSQILSLDIEEDRYSGLYESFEEGPEAVESEARVYPTLQSMELYNSFVSASIVLAKAKQFDDGLYAAVELLLRKKTGRFEGKEALLINLFSQMNKSEFKKEGAEADYCKVLIYAAAKLGGVLMDASADIQNASEKIIGEFINDKLKSKPIGFYTWNQALSGIFQQDRLLQQDLEKPEMFCFFRKSLLGDEKVKETYKKYNAFVQKLTNPFPPEFKDMLSEGDFSQNAKYCFFPPSGSIETELIKKMYGNKPIPAGFSLIDSLVEKIRNGQIDLTPRPDSGWYDYQVFSFEPFIIPEKMPEKDKLDFKDAYKKELISLFKAALALSRETHIKQLEIPMVGEGAPEDEEPVVSVSIYPGLSLEPLAAFYIRRAYSYTFIRRLLEDMFGLPALQAAHRITPEGEEKISLYEELLSLESLFYGMYFVCAAEIGLDTAFQAEYRTEEEIENDIREARAWFDEYQTDPDMAKDNRMMVPVFYDVERKKTKVWVMLGYAKKPLLISYAKTPSVVSIKDADGKEAKAKVVFEGSREMLAYPVSAEIYVDALLNRDEFRSLCDKYKTQSEILKALGADE